MSKVSQFTFFIPKPDVLNVPELLGQFPLEFSTFIRKMFPSRIHG